MACRRTYDGAQGAVPGMRASRAIDRVCRPSGGRPPPAGAVTLTAIHFSDPKTGWVAGRSCASVGSSTCHGLIEKTVDGGARWTVEYRGTLPVESLQFAGPTYGWALVGRDTCSPGGECDTSDILVTEDGGQTWSPQYRGTKPLKAVTLTAPGVGWAWQGTSSCARVGAPAAAVPPPCAGRLVRSTDGGTTWVPSKATSYPVGAIAFAGARGWAVELGPGTAHTTSAGTAATLGYPVQMPVTVMTTSDGGASWSNLSQIELPAYQAGLEARLAFAGPADGVLSFCQPGSFGMHGSCSLGLFGTSDGGRTWAPPPSSGTPPPIDCSTGALWSLAPSGALAVASPVNFAACNPVVEFAAGSVHHLTTVHQFYADGPVALDWLSADLGYALVAPQPGDQEAVARTVDGGRSWQQVFPAPTPTTAVDFVSASRGVGIGDLLSRGAVLTSSDGGSRWRVRADLGGYAIAVSAPSPNLIYAEYQPFTGTDAGRVLVARSADGGSHFTRRASLGVGRSDSRQPVGMWPLPYSGTPLRFVSSDVGFLATQAGILRTGDGGRSWRLSSGLPKLACKQRFCEELVATADVLSSRVALLDLMPPPAGLVRTADGGRRWRVLAASPPFDAVDFLDPQNGWAWWTGALLRTVDGGAHWELYVPPWRGEPVTDLYFLDSGRGWVAAGSELWATRTGGRSWSRVAGSSWPS